MIQRLLACVGLILAAHLAMLPLPAVANPSLEIIHRRHAQAQRQYAADLAPIAQDLRDSGATESAALAWRLAVPPEPGEFLSSELPETVSEEIPLDIPPEQRNALIRFRAAREKQSIALQVLGHQAVSAGSVQYAYELAREAARQDPDNAVARRILGFVRYQDRWVSPFESKMLRAGQVWHDSFGWLPEEHVARYEAGERFHRGRWISAAQDAELHRDFSNPWLIRTEHYLIKTNHSLEKGVEVAMRLERFHDFFVEVFAGFFWNPRELRSLFRGAASQPRDSRPYQVHYYRLREEYNQRLVRKIPQIAMTNGLYYTADRIAYFFHDEEHSQEDTLYHEATHQLMYEALPNDRDVAGQAHFWVIEGIACYMESFRDEGGTIAIGDPEHTRIIAARYRYLVDQHYTPLARFAAMGVQEFQNLPYAQLQRNYSQAAGLAHFFMHFDNGRYREAFIEHLAQLYQTSAQGRRRVQNLAELTGMSYDILDREYGQYMENLGPPRTNAAAVPAEDAAGVQAPLDISEAPNGERLVAPPN